MAKMRSPNYPMFRLSDALETARRLWDKEKRTAVPPDVAAKAMGYSSLSGPARSKIAALRQYGLIDDTFKVVRLSDLAMRALHQTGDERDNAIREAATNPALIREMAASHLEASDDAIRSYLIVTKGFSESGARQFIEVFRDAAALAKLGSEGYSDVPKSTESEQMIASQPNNVPQSPQPIVGHVFRWPLGRDVTAEVRLSGQEITPSHLELLRQYLELAKSALAVGPSE